MKDLAVRDVSVRYGSTLAVDRVDLAVPAGSAVGLVGESGSGKSTLARAITGLVPVTRGEILLGGQPLSSTRRKRCASPIQMVFQNANASLDPKLTAGQSVAEALHSSRMSKQELRRATAECLELVGLPSAIADRYPGELSGGQKQRVAIGRALAARPALLVADEITSALDMSVQASILNLLVDLRERLGLTLLFISHNLAAVRYLCDTTAVMYCGRILEFGPSDEIVRSPRCEYTRQLIDAVPTLAPRGASQTGTAAGLHL